MMPSLMKAAAFLYGTSTIATAIPHFGHEGPTSTPLWQNRQRSTIEFQTPCYGCFGGSDGGIEFDFTVYAADKPCGRPNLRLNEKPVYQETEDVDAWGSDSFKVKGPNGLGIHHISGDWQRSCLTGPNPYHEIHASYDDEDASQIFTFTVTQVDGKDVEEKSGFTVSFHQQRTPRILRYATHPVSISEDPSFIKSWRSPPPSMRLLPPGEGRPHQPHDDAPGSLEDEIRALQDLQAHASDLEWQIKERKERIASLMKQDLHDSIRGCDRGLKCILGTLVKQGPKFFSVMTSHMHHHLSSSPQSYKSGNSYSSHPCRPPSPHSHHRHHPPHRRRATIIFHTLYAAKTICVFVGLASIITLFVRKIRTLCSRRYKVERAARREQRRNERAYRRAARRQRWSNWWNNCRPFRPCGGNNAADYEEKRSLVRDQETALENNMQFEIAALRHAHELVNDLVRAEEGRIHEPVPVPGASPVELEAGGGRLSYRSTHSLPAYRSHTGSVSTASEPPGYEDELHGEIVVADGFQYRPQLGGGSSADTMSTGGSPFDTPDSSVVDCSPRLSAETGRTMVPEHDVGLGPSARDEGSKD